MADRVDLSTLVPNRAERKEWTNTFSKTAYEPVVNGERPPTAEEAAAIEAQAQNLPQAQQVFARLRAIVEGAGSPEESESSSSSGASDASDGDTGAGAGGAALPPGLQGDALIEHLIAQNLHLAYAAGQLGPVDDAVVQAIRARVQAAAAAAAADAAAAAAAAAAPAVVAPAVVPPGAAAPVPAGAAAPAKAVPVKKAPAKKAPAPAPTAAAVPAGAKSAPAAPTAAVPPAPATTGAAASTSGSNSAPDPAALATLLSALSANPALLSALTGGPPAGGSAPSSDAATAAPQVAGAAGKVTVMSRTDQVLAIQRMTLNQRLKIELLADGRPVQLEVEVLEKTEKTARLGPPGAPPRDCIFVPLPDTDGHRYYAIDLGANFEGIGRAIAFAHSTIARPDIYDAASVLTAVLDGAKHQMLHQMFREILSVEVYVGFVGVQPGRILPDPHLKAAAREDHSVQRRVNMTLQSVFQSQAMTQFHIDMLQIELDRLAEFRIMRRCAATKNGNSNDLLAKLREGIRTRTLSDIMNELERQL